MAKVEARVRPARRARAQRGPRPVQVDRAPPRARPAPARRRQLPRQRVLRPEGASRCSRRPGGSIVFVCSLGSRFMNPEYPLGAMKAAMETMVRQWAEEWAGRGIHANAVCAGPRQDRRLPDAPPDLAEVATPARRAVRDARGGRRRGHLPDEPGRARHPRPDPRRRPGPLEPGPARAAPAGVRAPSRGSRRRSRMPRTDSLHATAPRSPSSRVRPRMAHRSGAVRRLRARRAYTPPRPTRASDRSRDERRSSRRGRDARGAAAPAPSRWPADGREFPPRRARTWASPLVGARPPACSTAYLVHRLPACRTDLTRWRQDPKLHSSTCRPRSAPRRLG